MRLDIDGDPLAEERLLESGRLRQGVVLLLADRIVLLVHTLDIQPHDAGPNLGLVGASSEVVRLRRQIRQVADSEVPVLLRGETGTGKELVALAIHRCSRRRDRELVCVNLAAIPAALAAAELFGAERGAFTGADRTRLGFFQQAAGGTLLLDEIGEAPVDVQALLLRALDSHEVQPLGATRPQAADVRVIAATDADLEQAIDDGRFRAPLLHRLNGFSLHLPPLRQRLDDLGRLLAHFLRIELTRLGRSDRLDPADLHDRPWLPASAVAQLARHPWPGNIRELINACRRIAIAGQDRAEVSLEAAGLDLRPGDTGQVIESKPQPVRARRTYRPASDVGEEELIEALRSNRWRLLPTATQLGISRTSLYTLVDQCATVRRASELSREEVELSRARHDGNLDLMADELEVSRQGLQKRLRSL